MDFFKSVFSPDPDPPTDDYRRSSDDDDDDDRRSNEGDDEEPEAPDPAGGGGPVWNFGGLIKTFATKSESVIQTYRRDLEEFGSGLKKETAAIREAAARAVLDLPTSLEAGASVAQDSLESVGQAIDDIGGTVWRGTAEITKKIVPLLSDDSSPDPSFPSPDPASASKRYSRFDAQVLAIQSDPSMFADEPDDAEDYRTWKSEFDLAAKEEEIDSLCYENNNLETIFEKLVPRTVDYDTFWSRYYYRVYKLKQAEDARAHLVKRVISREEEDEELTWEVDDDEEEEGEKKEARTEKEEAIAVVNDKVEEKEIEVNEPAVESLEVGTATMADVEAEEAPSVAGNEGTPTPPLVVGKADDDGEVASKVEDEVTPEAKADNDGEVASKVEDEVTPEAKADNDGEVASKVEDEVMPEAKADPAESSKDSDFSVISSQQSMQEEDDLGWDEIEDLGENDEKKAVVSCGSPNRVDLRKRLSAAEDDEDLSWDIEDDEDNTKP